jgi:hypothetical protein
MFRIKHWFIPKRRLGRTIPRVDPQFEHDWPPEDWVRVNRVQNKIVAFEIETNSQAPHYFWDDLAEAEQIADSRVEDNRMRDA